MEDFVRVEHLAKLDGQLKAAATGLQGEVRKANREAALIVAEEARVRAPVGESAGDTHPGTLEGTVGAGAGHLYGYVRVGGGAAAQYAKPIVFGWHAHNIRANHFPFEARDARKPDVEAYYALRVDQILHTLFEEGV